MLKLIPSALVALFLFCATSYAGSPPACLYEHEMAHAGGWGASHPGAIYTKRCGHLPMPPRAFPIKGKKPIIRYMTPRQVQLYCTPFGIGVIGIGRVQACSTIGGNPAKIYLPKS